MKNLGTSVASYTYNSVGNRLTQANHNGTSTEYAYDNDDPRYVMNSITHKHGQTELAKIDYAPTGYDGRDAAGNPLSMTDWTGTWTYGYDANNRLTTAVPPNPIPDQPAGGPYGYDWVGNRLNPPVGTNHMTYNAADQLTSWPGMHTYTYYPDGSLHEEKNAAGTSTLKSYTYTPDGLLATATFDGKTLTNTWDAGKNRVGFSVNSTSHAFVYDTTAGIPAVVQEDDVYYVREPGGSLLARVDDSDVSYYHFDQLGSTRLLTNGSGVVTDKYDYDAYGAPIARDRLAGSVDQPYQYVGMLGYYAHWQEPGFGLVYLGVRAYGPIEGRFVQRDPIERPLHSSYSYADADPTGVADPTGYKPGDYEFCQIRFKTCIDRAGKRFGDCIRRSVGVSDLSANVAGCIVACGLSQYVWPGSYKLCCSGCMVVMSFCTYKDVASCQLVLDSEVSSCRLAFELCKKDASKRSR